jgi:hypothetical protein
MFTFSQLVQEGVMVKSYGLTLRPRPTDITWVGQGLLNAVSGETISRSIVPEEDGNGPVQTNWEPVFFEAVDPFATETTFLRRAVVR